MKYQVNAQILLRIMRKGGHGVNEGYLAKLGLTYVAKSTPWIATTFSNEPSKSMVF